MQGTNQCDRNVIMLLTNSYCVKTLMGIISKSNND